jgi:iron complex transport system substrate-binding protein
MRVVSLAPSNTEILFALGLGPELVAVSSFCNFPEAAKSLPRLPGWSTIRAADVVALKPDLVLSSSICQEPLRQELAAAGLGLAHIDPRSLDEVAHSFIQIGGLFGRQAEGRALSRAFHAALDPFKASAPQRRPRIYIEEWDKPPMAAGNWVPEMVLAAGGEPFNRELGQLSREISWEELMEFDPEIAVYSICGVGLHFDPAAFLRVEGWNTLQAAKAGAVYSVNDDYFNIPGPRLAQGVALLRELMQGKTGPAVRALGATAAEGKP